MQNNLEKLQRVFREVFENKNLIITPTTSSDDIKMWDSLTHLQLITAIEQEFDIKFSFEKVMMFHTVKNILESLP